MTIAIMQPYLFPYLGYFQLVQAVDKFVFYDDVAFIKQGWINRNNILLNHKKHMIIAPVKGISSFKRINETEIDYKLNWTKKLLLTIEQAYKKAPEFQKIFPILQEILWSNKTTIADLSIYSVIKISNYLGIETIFQESSSIYGNQELKGKERVIDICKQEGAERYINPIGGKELYAFEDFNSHGLALNFIKSKPLSYRQYTAEFEPSLSIIDVLMFNSKEKVLSLLDEYDLV
jgi:hypothetical protein